MIFKVGDKVRSVNYPYLGTGEVLGVDVLIKGRIEVKYEEGIYFHTGEGLIINLDDLRKEKIKRILND